MSRVRRTILTAVLGLGLVVGTSTSAWATTLFFNTDTPTVNSWTSFNILLNAAGWVVDDYNAGPAATEAQLQAVLANLTALYILTEWKTGLDDTNVDNVVFGSGASDTFSTNNGGWVVAGADPGSDVFNQSVPTSSLNWDANFGNPAGSVRVGDVYFWTWIAAPAAYLGNQSARYGESLSLDIYIRDTDNARYPLVALVAPDDAQPPAPVPEPGTLLLLGGGLAAARFARRRSSPASH